LTLAVALKSPLVGLDDEDLLRIAGSRPPDESPRRRAARHADGRRSGGSRAAAGGGGGVAASGWPHGPVRFYAPCLGRWTGERLVAGRRDGGGRDRRFLRFAHGFERTDTPSVITFFARFERGLPPISRELEPSGGGMREKGEGDRFFFIELFLSHFI
jgi:ATP-dependent helicase/nuclease subunit A